MSVRVFLSPRKQLIDQQKRCDNRAESHTSCSRTREGCRGRGGGHSEGVKSRESGVKRQESRLERESGVGKLRHTEPTKVALINAVSMTMTKGKKRGEGVGGNGCQPGLHNGEYNARCARVCVCVRNFGNVCRSFLMNFFNRQSTQCEGGRQRGRVMVRASQRL